MKPGLGTDLQESTRRRREHAETLATKPGLGTDLQESTRRRRPESPLPTRRADARRLPG